MSADTKRAVETLAVFSQYGRTMLAVQIWEMQLATLVLVASVKDPHRVRSGHPWRQVRRGLKTTIHHYLRATASELRNGLPGALQQELSDDLDKAVRWRDRLAHRYLRERMDDTDVGLFKPGTLSELEQLARGFDRFAQRLQEEHQRLTEDWPKGEELPEELREALQAVGRGILRSEPISLPSDPDDHRV